MKRLTVTITVDVPDTVEDDDLHEVADNAYVQVSEPATQQDGEYREIPTLSAAHLTTVITHVPDPDRE